MVLTEEEVFLMNDIFKNAAVDSYGIFIILCVLTFSQRKQKEIAYLSNRQKDWQGILKYILLYICSNAGF